MSRGQASSVVARTAGLDPAPRRPASFSDIAGTTHEGTIEALHDEGIVEGYRDGTFRPRNALPRDQAASMLARWLGLDPVATGPFTDVPAGSVHAGAINALHAEGIINGTTPTTFSPRVDVRRDQFAALVNRSR